MTLPSRRTWNPDATPPGATLAPNERLLLRRIEERVRSGEFELPQLPSTVHKVMSLAANPKSEVDEIVEVISSDPVLSSELLKAANSVLYGGRTACDSLRDAVMRLGLRGVRGVVLTLSMRSAILRDPRLMTYATEVWRQSIAVAHLARHLSGPAGVEPESAYLMGLTHDIGKVALLSLVSKETRNAGRLSGAFLGTLFVQFHEQCGSRMAEEWSLPPEIVSIAGCHHAFAENPDHPRQAALVSLAHKMDLFVSQALELDYRRLHRAEEMEVLGIPRNARAGLLRDGLPLLETTEQFVRSAA